MINYSEQVNVTCVSLGGKNYTITYLPNDPAGKYAPHGELRDFYERGYKNFQKMMQKKGFVKGNAILKGKGKRGLNAQGKPKGATPHDPMDDLPGQEWYDYMVEQQIYYRPVDSHVREPVDRRVPENTWFSVLPTDYHVRGPPNEESTNFMRWGHHSEQSPMEWSDKKIVTTFTELSAYGKEFLEQINGKDTGLEGLKIWMDFKQELRFFRCLIRHRKLEKKVNPASILQEPEIF